MNKAFESLADNGSEVSVETGLRAAEKLQSVLDGRDQGTDVARIRVELGRIIEAVRSIVPEDMWPEILAKLDGAEQHPGALDVEADILDDADDAYDPTEFAEEDDYF